MHWQSQAAVATGKVWQPAFFAVLCQCIILQSIADSVYCKLQSWDDPNCGLLLSERLVNCPPQLAPPLNQALFDETAWAQEDEPTQVSTLPLEFAYIVQNVGALQHALLLQSMILRQNACNSASEANMVLQLHCPVYRDCCFMQALRDSFKFENFILVSRVFTDPSAAAPQPKKQKVSITNAKFFT